MIAPIVAEDLNRICSELDRGVFPRVRNGGFVTPSVSPSSPIVLGGVANDERQRTRRSETGPRQGTARRKGASDRATGQADQGSSVLHNHLWTQYAAEVKTVKEAYPSAQVWKQEHGFWFLTESALLPGLERKAVFLTGIKLSDIPVVQGWGFWNGVTWIGPRHTNFPDGSICAFERTDGTWNVGDSLVELLDLYTLWAFRHLYLEYFGRWPGRQAVFEPYERILELKPDEFCGCGREGILYGECCASADRQRNLIKDAISFNLRYYNGVRRPPVEVEKFLIKQSPLPDVGKLLQDAAALSPPGHFPYLLKWPRSA